MLRALILYFYCLHKGLIVAIVLTIDKYLVSTKLYMLTERTQTWKQLHLCQLIKLKLQSSHHILTSERPLQIRGQITNMA